MKLPQMCVSCLFDNHEDKAPDKRYVDGVKEILDNRQEDDSAPYLSAKFKELYEKLYGKQESIAPLKEKYNKYVLDLEEKIKEKIELSEDPLLASLIYARVGNYIDFATVDNIDNNEFLSLLYNAEISEKDCETYESFISQCEKAKTFLFICDNCGEIVLDRIFLEQFRKRFPEIKCQAMVRGGEIQNDVTIEDAEQSGMSKIAEIVDSGMSIAGIIYNRMPLVNRRYIDSADVILAKGQGNFESLSGNGVHVFYSFLCKCDYFTERFNVPKLTGMFIEVKE